MAKVTPTYKISLDTVRRVNAKLIREGISKETKNSYNGEISVSYKTKDGIVKKTFSKEEIKEAYGKALKQYAEKF